MGKTKQIVYRHPIDGREGQIVDLAYSPTGHVLFGLRSGPSADLWALPFSVSEMKATGEATLLYAGAAFPSISADGTLVFSRRNPDQLLRLAKFDRSGRLLSNFGTLQYHNPLGPAWARDGKRAIGTVFNPDGRTADLWMHDATNSYQLTFANEYAFAPAWSPDGSNVLFFVQSSGRQEQRLMVIPSSGGETCELFPGVRSVFTPDGRAIVYSWSPRPRTGPYEIRTCSFPANTNPPVTLFRTESFIGAFSLSPDGRFIAYESGDDSSSPDISQRDSFRSAST